MRTKTKSKKRAYTIEAIEIDFEDVVHEENSVSMEVTPINEMTVTLVDQYGNYKTVIDKIILN